MVNNKLNTHIFGKLFSTNDIYGGNLNDHEKLNDERIKDQREFN